MAEIQVVAKPFHPPGSLVRKMIEEGKLLDRSLTALWRQELRKKPHLPVKFRDTAAAVAEFVQQGLDVTLDEFSLTTGRSDAGRPVWIAETRRNRYLAKFQV